MNNDGKITAPVSVSDIRSVINESSYSLFELCTSDNINMYAVWKPFSIGTNLDGTTWNAYLFHPVGFSIRQRYGFGLLSKVVQSSLYNFIYYLTELIDGDTNLYLHGFIEWDKTDLITHRLADFINIDAEDKTTTIGYNHKATLLETYGTTNPLGYVINTIGSKDFSNGVTNQDINGQVWDPSLGGSEGTYVNWSALDNVSMSELKTATSVNVFDILKYSVLGQLGAFSTLDTNYKRIIIIFGNEFLGYVIYPDSTQIPWKDWANDMQQEVGTGGWFYSAEALISNDDAARISTGNNIRFCILPNSVTMFFVKFDYSVTMSSNCDPYTNIYDILSLRLSGTTFNDLTQFTIEYCYYTPSTGFIESISGCKWKKSDFTSDLLNSTYIDMAAIGHTYGPDASLGDDLHLLIRFREYNDDALTSQRKEVKYDADSGEYVN